MKIEQSQIDIILQQEDIEGLIEHGAPKDEYTSEAERITLALSNLTREKLQIENIVAILVLIWMEHFDLSETDMVLRMPAIRRIAGLISKL